MTPARATPCATALAPADPHRQPSRRSAAVGSSAVRDLLAVAHRDDVVSLAGGLPDADSLPGHEVAAAVARVVGSADALQYGPTEGDPALRRWIAEHELGGADPARVVVTHGAQQALQLVVDAVVDPGDVAVVEAASYVGMLQPLRAAGARIVAAESDEHGLRPLSVASLARRTGPPTLLYLAPTFQNPTGTVLPEVRRRQVGRLAAQLGLLVVDDDPYRRLGAGVGPPVRLRDAVPDDLAVTVGSFSKTVAPALRVGWVHAPEWLVPAIVRVKQAADLHTGTLAQRVVADLVGRPGWLEERCSRLAGLYLHRREVLADALVRHLPPGATVGRPDGGMFSWVDLSGCGVHDTDAVARLALDHGVAVVPASAFSPHGRPGPGLRVAAATQPDDRLELGASRLGAAVRATARAGARGG